jgi:hypothetical protein
MTLSTLSHSLRSHGKRNYMAEMCHNTLINDSRISFSEDPFNRVIKKVKLNPVAHTSPGLPSPIHSLMSAKTLAHFFQGQRDYGQARGDVEMSCEVYEKICSFCDGPIDPRLAIEEIFVSRGFRGLLGMYTSTIKTSGLFQDFHVWRHHQLWDHLHLEQGLSRLSCPLKRTLYSLLFPIVGPCA